MQAPFHRVVYRRYIAQMTKEIIETEYHHFCTEYDSSFNYRDQYRLVNSLPRLRQYKSRTTAWRLDKNIKPAEMKSIVKKMQKRKLVEVNKPELIFRMRGKGVVMTKVACWMKNHGLSDSMPYSPESVVGMALLSHRQIHIQSDLT
jgi:hypothetical protein